MQIKRKAPLGGMAGIYSDAMRTKMARLEKTSQKVLIWGKSPA